jgi:hypothetical protein
MDRDWAKLMEQAAAQIAASMGYPDVVAKAKPVSLSFSKIEEAIVARVAAEMEERMKNENSATPGPVEPAPSPEPKVENWWGFAKGDRVQTRGRGTGTITGAWDNYLLIKLDDGSRGCGPDGEIGQRADWLTRLSPPAPSSPEQPEPSGEGFHGFTKGERVRHAHGGFKGIGVVVRAAGACVLVHLETDTRWNGRYNAFPYRLIRITDPQESPPVKTTVKVTSDPYREHAANPAHGYADWLTTQTGIASGLSKLDQAKAQLDRKTVSVGGKYGKRVPVESAHWPEANEWEP